MTATFDGQRMLFEVANLIASETSALFLGNTTYLITQLVTDEPTVMICRAAHRALRSAVRDHRRIAAGYSSEPGSTMLPLRLYASLSRCVQTQRCQKIMLGSLRFARLNPASSAGVPK